MEVRFTAAESVEMPVEEQTIPIQHYLRQPQRLVNAIADPSLMEPLSEDLFLLKMRPLNFMNIYRFQPTVVLKVWSTTKGTVYLQSQSCEIRGIDYINDRFFLNVTGILSPQQRQDKMYLVGHVDLEVKVELPPPVRLTPTPLLEVTGNGLLKSVLIRIKQRILGHLLHDYQQWIKSDRSLETSLEQTLPILE